MIQNRYITIFTMLVLVWAGASYGQQPQPSPQSVPKRTLLAPISRSGVVDMRNPQIGWDPYLKTVDKTPLHGIDPRKQRADSLKAVANLEKETLRAKGQLGGDAKTTAMWPPTLGEYFFGNLLGPGDPADNTLAISAEGKILSGSNCYWATFDTLGTAVSSLTFQAFAAAGGITTPNLVYDPKCLYDVEADRFIATFINGSSSANSKVVIAFSQTNDPAGSYNVYTVSGDVDSMGVWIDYTQIGINHDELFVTGNPYTDGTTVNVGAAVWQINKADGYAGNPLTPARYFLPNSACLHPVSGAVTLYGPQMYFLESDFGTSTNIKLHEITNSIANNGVLNPPLDFSLNVGYSYPPDGDQPGNFNDLRTFDTRVQSAYYENSRIEFTLNTGYLGRAAVYHGIGVIVPSILSFSQFTAEVVSDPNLDLAYGAVAYAGQQDISGYNHSYITFNSTGANQFPGMGAVYADENGTSPITTIKIGAAGVNAVGNRWGDYSDVSERPGRPGEVWAAGTFGNNTNRQRTYIGQLLPPVVVGDVASSAPEMQMEVYPNPTVERVEFVFPVTTAAEYQVWIRNLEGQDVQLVIQDWLAAGKAKLSFNTALLASGTYFVVVENGDQRLFTEKLVVQH